MIRKEIREQVWVKYGKHCAYCGSDITYKQLQIDHIRPLLNYYGGLRSEIPDHHHDNIKNLNPSCARCNRWKHTFTIERFREEIQKQLIRLKKNSSNYRLALDFGMIKEDNKPIIFYFESLTSPSTKDNR